MAKMWGPFVFIQVLASAVGLLALRNVVGHHRLEVADGPCARLLLDLLSRHILHVGVRLRRGVLLQHVLQNVLGLAGVYRIKTRHVLHVGVRLRRGVLLQHVLQNVPGLAGVYGIKLAAAVDQSRSSLFVWDRHVAAVVVRVGV